MATIQRFEDLMMFKKARELTKAVYTSLASCRDNGFRDQIQRASVSLAGEKRVRRDIHSAELVHDIGKFSRQFMNTPRIKLYILVAKAGDRDKTAVAVALTFNDQLIGSLELLNALSWHLVNGFGSYEIPVKRMKRERRSSVRH